MIIIIIIIIKIIIIINDIYRVPFTKVTKRCTIRDVLIYCKRLVNNIGSS